jgi:tRNA A-37 threonylcarbamoyl transferase component Bud32
MSPQASKIICPGCRAAFDASTNYCSRCGTSLGATPAEDRVRRTEPAVAVPPALLELRASDAPGQDPLIGRVIDGRYRVLERIGTGGMGIVYKVEHQRMGKLAAMKVLHRDLAGDREVMRRFHREAEAVSKLTHPNTVQTFDFGAADGVLYLVMELVRGEDLGQLVRRDGPLPFRTVAPVMMQVCDALGEAHELGIVHRDLKPENVLVTHTKDARDHAKVLDFGLATISEREDGSAITGKNQIAGTPYYMSPEQIRGEPLDGRSDIYSLGCVMVKVLTGEPPFHAQSPVGVLTKHLTDELVPPSRRRPDLDLPRRVDEIVARATAKDRDARYPTVEALRDDLARALAEISQPVTKAASLSTPVVSEAVHPRLEREDFDAFERSLRRRGVARALVVPLALAAAAAAAVAYFRHQRELPQSTELEPNNSLQTATPIAPGADVRGKIGMRPSAEEGDRDYFRLATGATPRAPKGLRGEVTAIPNIDLTLAAFDGNGKFLGSAEAQGIGAAERLVLDVSDDPVYLVVVEKRGSAPVPTENLSDGYRLTVTVGPPAPPAPEKAPRKKR